MIKKKENIEEEKKKYIIIHKNTQINVKEKKINKTRIRKTKKEIVV
jgi:hypothetical protein